MDIVVRYNHIENYDNAEDIKKWVEDEDYSALAEVLDFTNADSINFENTKEEE